MEKKQRTFERHSIIKSRDLSNSGNQIGEKCYIRKDGESMKKYIYPLVFGILLLVFTGYVILDTFVIPQELTPASTIVYNQDNQSSETSDTTDSNDTESSNEESTDSTESTHHDKSSQSGNHSRENNHRLNSASDTGSSSLGSNSMTASNSDYYYSQDGVTITINTYLQNDTKIYVADVVLEDSTSLATALANNTYGNNIKEKTSEIAESVGAILAINGDFYGAQESGYVIRNGILYRNSAKADQEDLVIMEDGSFKIINESDVTAEELLAQGAYQVLCFGPALVENGQISVTSSDEVGKAMSDNPRTAIGYISENHYVFVISDGRTDESEGLSLYELASFMESLGVETAYNLDGGGSTTMYFDGQVINNPTTNGSRIKERSVSDIVYIG